MPASPLRSASAASSSPNIPPVTGHSGAGAVRRNPASIIRTSPSAAAFSATKLVRKSPGTCCPGGAPSTRQASGGSHSAVAYLVPGRSPTSSWLTSSTVCARPTIFAPSIFRSGRTVSITLAFFALASQRAHASTLHSRARNDCQVPRLAGTAARRQDISRFFKIFRDFLRYFEIFTWHRLRLDARRGQRAGLRMVGDRDDGA
eukprot:SAG31_NODE_636_length_13344_cov_8.492451_9_plen_203_part_00